MTAGKVRKLTDAELLTLERCADLEDGGADGIHHGGDGNAAKRLRRLEAAGLLRFVALGSDVDGEMGDRDDLPIYALTPAGREAQAEWINDAPRRRTEPNP